LLRAALHFFDLSIFQVPIVLLLFAALGGYGVIFLALSRLTPDRAYLYAALVVISALIIYWLRFDHSIHASDRYYLRTALVIVTPAFGALAVLSAWAGDGEPALLFPRLQMAITAAPSRFAQPLAAAFVILTLVHVVETVKFVAAWRDYKAAVTALAMTDESDPVLGNARFISSGRIAADLNRLSWFSTTPYLSVVVAHFIPNRLVIDPAGNYFWLSCDTATANAKAISATSAESRDLVRIYSCLHR
jgi:predicted membrane-bound spermidine synthase